MAFTTSDLTLVEDAIRLFMQGKLAEEVRINGRMARYAQMTLPQLQALRAAILRDIAASGSGGGLSLIKPGGRL